MSKFEKPKKRNKAIWTTAYPEQSEALHPERSRTGGVKARSQSQSVRMEVYKSIRGMFLTSRRYCEAHETLRDDIKEVGFTPYWQASEDVHHQRGRDGLLLFDVRWFLPVCRKCHEWIEANKAKAVAFGFTAPAGQWRNEE